MRHPRRPRPSRARPVRRYKHADIPEPGLQAVHDRAGSGDQLLQLDRAQPRVVLTGRHDAISFNQIGIPASGLLTGQDCCKSQQEVNLFGGHLGNFEGNIPSFDGGCVDNPFRWCDNLSNNDPNVLTFM